MLVFCMHLMHASADNRSRRIRLSSDSRYQLASEPKSWYEIPGAGHPPQSGVDSFQLARRGGDWVIASILNEIPTPDRPVPAVLTIHDLIPWQKPHEHFATRLQRWGYIRAMAEPLAEHPVMVETDSPFLAPVPHRGKRNEPAYVVEVGRRLAELWGRDEKDVASASTAVFRDLFGLESDWPRV